tara:strand:+ start:7281 stop:10721 length:3441 start_codon:yes stop_codon:yes gene_type:complete
VREIEDKISLFVKDQFPAFYAEEGNVFREFLGAYYEYLETTGKTIDVARNQLEYRDIDKTTAEFLEQFKKTYLADLPGLIKTDDRLTIKNIMDFYKSKGSQRSIQLLFRILFNDSATVHYPSEDVIKPSDAKFILPRYIEVYAPSYDNLKSLEGIEIIGATTQAKAFVETISTKLLNGIRTNVLRLSNVRGDFNRGEVISKSSDGIQDDMPVVTGSLSDIEVTLGGSDNKIGDVFNITAATGKQGKARVTGIDDATGLVSFTLNDGGFGFTLNTSFTTIDINSQNIQLENIVNAAQSYSNSSMIDNAKYFEFETVTQDLETVTILAGTDLISNIQTYIANTEKTTAPIIKGLDSANNEIANGYLIAIDDVATSNATLTIAPYYGTFGPARKLSIVPLDAGHGYEANGSNEPIDEESTIAITYISNTATITNGTVITQANSGANGIVASSNSTVFVVNGAFGTFNTTDDVEYGSSDTANVTAVSITTSGANAVIATSNTTRIVVSDLIGEFNENKKVKGRRTNAIATIDTSGVVDTGASDVVIVAADYDDISSGNVEAVIDVYSNVSVTGQVIGSNDTNIGLRNTVYANGASANFVANSAAFVLGDVSNTYANIVLVGTGTGATFKIGGLENEDAVTIYTDIIGSNNAANISYLDCIIDGGNSGIGFLDSITVNDGGTGYTNGQSLKFDRGGPGGGAPNINAFASLLTDASGNVQTITVDTLGRGFYTSSPANTDNLSPAGSGLDITANFDFGYGLPKDTNGDYTSVLDTVLTKFSGNLGTITALTEINPGNNYNLDPFVKVRTAGVAGFDRRDVKLNLIPPGEVNGKSGTFIPGEILNQTISETGQTLGLTSLAGQYTNGDSFSVNTESFAVGGSLIQVINSTANAIGDIYSTPNATHISVKNSRIKLGDGTFEVNAIPFRVDGSDLGQLLTVPNTDVAFIRGEIANLQSSAASATSKGKVKIDHEAAVTVKRLSFSVGLANNAIVTGALSGATGTVTSVEQDHDSKPIGDNANLTAIAQAANGIVTALEVTDSGFGYQHDSDLTLISTNTAQNIVVSGKANVTTTGIGEGFWEDKSSFLNNKYIHDNDLYQSYSYLIESGLSLDKYRDVVLKAAHIAGTKLFGRVTRESIVNNSITIANSSIGAL